MQQHNQSKATINTKTRFQFGIHPSVQMVQAWVSRLKEKTGKTLEEWVDLLQQSDLKTRPEQIEWLKQHYKFSSMAASWIAEKTEGIGWDDGNPTAYLQAAQTYIDAMFAGPKEKLYPIYESLLSISYALGKDVKACPCKTIVPLYRNHVFAQIKPTTRTRIDLGLALGNMKAPSRLINTGGYEKKDRITYRIPLTSLNDIDDEITHWLKIAYEFDA